ncbi:polymeric immunoglobulin receptor isoform 2-T2 [Pholidichthys leucotaenia]
MLQFPKFTFILLPWIPAFLCGVTTVEEFAVLEGRSITIPCHYEPKYASYVKYWCRGSMREFCTSLVRSDDTHSTNPSEAKVSIFDDPVQQMFTVVMNDLKEGDAGWYMCGVEIGNGWKADDGAYTKVKVIHGMSVVNSEVVGEEGSSVTVECLYSEKFRESEKKWCRSGDWSSCLLTGSEGNYEDTSVAIRDDRTGAFTVTMKNLQLRDAGWYWCCAGQQLIPVQVLVKPQPTTMSVTSPSTPTEPTVKPAKHISETFCSRHRNMLESIVGYAALLLLSLSLTIFIRKLWKLQKQNSALRQARELKAELTEYPGDQHNTIIFLNKDSLDAHVH